MYSSLPPATASRQGITPAPTPATPSEHSSGLFTLTSSWASTRGLSAMGPGPDRPALAWAGVRHRMEEEDKSGEATTSARPGASACSQVILVTCLHLQHEMVQREMGMYAWTLPVAKDPAGSTLKIMRRYTKQIRELNPHAELNVRTAPDPSKRVIQHHLRDARMAAGPDGYIAVLYNGQGIHEPPTEAGELWCYDKSFDECIDTGTGPAEYIPILLFDLLTWAGASSCYIWDCQHAGRFIKAALAEGEEIDTQLQAAALANPSVGELHPPVYAKRQIHFAACGAGESLPRVLGLPEDLFTACLTTPLRLALLYHNFQTYPIMSSHARSFTQRSSSYMALLHDNMSPAFKDRLWKELQAILSTIAWQVLQADEYEILFSQNGNVISTFACGFLVAQRVMSTYHANPKSIPAIPWSTSHTLWTTWDLILDSFFEQLPAYFDSEEINTDWEKDIQLVSFIGCQLEGVLTPTPSLDPGASETSQGLSRLPIMCSAALLPTFQKTACQALDICLRGLNMRGLSQAIQGGALDVAYQLLNDHGDDLALELVSIWASLIRHQSSITQLAKDITKRSAIPSTGAVDTASLAAGLNSVAPKPNEISVTDQLPSAHAPTATAPPSHRSKSIKFFLYNLERYLLVGTGNRHNDNVSAIQSAAVLSALANHLPSVTDWGYQALGLAGCMLDSTTPLVQQWGAFLIAGIMGSPTFFDPAPAARGVTEDEDQSKTQSLDELKIQLLDLVECNNVDTRSTAMYALARWIPLVPYVSAVKEESPAAAVDLEYLGPGIEIAMTIRPLARSDGSPLVRKEIVGIFHRILCNAGPWTTLALWLYSLDAGIKVIPSKRHSSLDMMDRLKGELKLQRGQILILGKLMGIIKSLSVLQHDPDIRVVKVTYALLKGMIDEFAPHIANTEWEDIFACVFPPSLVVPHWTEGTIEALHRLGSGNITSWNNCTAVGATNKLAEHAVNKDLFESCKVSLHTHLVSHTSKTPAGDPANSSRDFLNTSALQDRTSVAPPNQNTNPNERTWILRHRVLEDSLLVAEQQVGLPWKWAMKDIVSPDVWTSMACHSFDSSILACNDSHDIMFWDWSASKSLGSFHLPLAPKVGIRNARFVNELHTSNIILAELSNGVVHVIAGTTQSPSEMRSISSFSALDTPTSSTKLPNKSGNQYPGEPTTQPTYIASQPKLVTSWWRQNGRLIVGGASDILNVWDCPAERCLRALKTEADSTATSIIHEPVSGNIIFAGFESGVVKLYDLRQRRGALLSWQGDSSTAEVPISGGRGIVKLGMALGESRTVTSACSNGMINIHDIRSLSAPVTSVLAHPDGMASASFQAHSGLMTTVSNLFSAHAINDDKDPIGAIPQANWGIYRSTTSLLSCVTEETLTFAPIPHIPKQREGYHLLQPYTFIHPLRPYLGVGYGTTCFLKGSGVGQGDDTDSGSYSFLKAQAKFIT